MGAEKESAKISVLNPRQSARDKKYFSQITADNFSQMGAEEESAKISVLNQRQSARDKNHFSQMLADVFADQRRRRISENQRFKSASISERKSQATPHYNPNQYSISVTIMRLPRRSVILNSNSIHVPRNDVSPLLE